MSKNKTATTKVDTARSAAPNTKDKTPDAAPKKPEKVNYPGLAEGQKIQGTEFPADFNASMHKPLKRSDFANEWVWLAHRADELAKKAAEMKAEADQIRTLGSSKDVKAAKKIGQLLKRAEELKSQLAGDGTDVDALLKALAASVS